LINTPPLFVDSQGSYQPSLSNGNGNQFTTFGQLPLMKEYGPATDGSDVRWTGRVGPDTSDQLYRGFKLPWHAAPYYPPSVVVLKSNVSSPEYYGYVSWNGATDVTGWNVYAGPTNSSKALVWMGQVGFRGFETRFNVHGLKNVKYVQVGGVVNGTEVKRSYVVAV